MIASVSCQYLGLLAAGEEGRYQSRPHQDMGIYLLLAPSSGPGFLRAGQSPGVPEELARNLCHLEGRLVFYAGLIGAVAVGMWYMRKHELPILEDR